MGKREFGSLSDFSGGTAFGAGKRAGGTPLPGLHASKERCFAGGL